MAYLALCWPIAVFAVSLVLSAPALAREDRPVTAIPAPETAPTATTSDGGSPSLVALLESVPDAGPRAPAYMREEFGPGWGDPDRNGCDARNDVLGRDLENVVFKPGTHECVVLSGILHDPYTGQTLEFVRGNQTSELVQIDHVVPLSWAWAYGAHAWTTEQRIAFHSDELNLLAVDGPTNQGKSDLGPSDWIPRNAEFHCAYAEIWVRVLVQYELTIPTEDRTALEAALRTC